MASDSSNADWAGRFDALQARLEACWQQQMQATIAQVTADLAQILVRAKPPEYKSGSSTLHDQKQLLAVGRPVPDDEEFRQTEPQLSTSGFLEDMLPIHEHYVIPHLSPFFSKELKQHKLRLCAELDEFCWLHRQHALWRIYYTERDRIIMEEVWQLPLIQTALQNMLRRHAPTPQRPRFFGQSRSGPY